MGESVGESVDPTAKDAEHGRTQGPGHGPAHGHGRHAGTRRLLALFRPQVNRGQLLAGALCAVLGFALVTQVRQDDPALTTLRNSEVIALLQEVTKRSNQLESQGRDLRSRLEALQGGSDKAEVAREVAVERIDLYSVLAGTRAVAGPGIELQIADPEGGVRAALLLDTIQELRGAGAEAIQVGDVRVVAGTAFVDTDETGVRVGDELVRAPYRILAIGESASLARALAIPGGVLEQLRSRQAEPTVVERTELRITARHTPEQPHYARPAASASS